MVLGQPVVEGLLVAELADVFGVDDDRGHGAHPVVRGCSRHALGDWPVRRWKKRVK